MKRLAALILAVLMLFAAASAVYASPLDEALPAACQGASEWAEDEIAEAAELGFIPRTLADNLKSGITRAEFAKAAVFFLAAQFRVENESLLSARFGIGPENLESPFSDVSDVYVDVAYAYGVIAGRGNGIFDPDSLITREEAAKILMNTYRAYALTESDEPDASIEPDDAGLRFSDRDTVSEWARADVRTVSEWGVMNGVSATEFDPKGTYTREQCFVTFLRLWKNGPCSRAKGTAKNLLTYGEVMDSITRLEFYKEFMRVETSRFTLVYFCQTTGRPGNVYCYIVWKDGGFRDVFDELPDAFLYDFDRSVPEGVKADENGDATFDCVADAETGKTVRYRIEAERGRIVREGMPEPSDFLRMTVGEIRERFGEPKLEYSEHGPGAPVYSLASVPGVFLLFTGFMMDEPLTDERIPEVVLLGEEYGEKWQGIKVGDSIDLHSYDGWKSAVFSVMDGTAHVSRPVGGLILTCIVVNPFPVPSEDEENIDWAEWEHLYLGIPQGDIAQIRIGRKAE